MLTLVLLVAVGFVAFTNGANANFKGVASLYGSGTTTLRQALGWATVTTFAGSLAASMFAQGMVKKFSGRGIVPDALVESPEFVIAVALGAAATSFLATRFGFPVSTTHALIGSLVGAGLVGSGTQVQALPLLHGFVYPLLLSPVIAVVGGAVVGALFRLAGLDSDRPSRWLNVCHFLSTGAASFARGLNDTPKIAALLLLVPWIDLRIAVLLVAVGIAVGALLDAEGVAETLGKKVTAMNASQGFAASVVTATLVTTASLHSLPVSTTHVSVGSLIGIGIRTRQAKWKNVIAIVLAWGCTVPCGAVAGAVAYRLIQVASAASGLRLG